ncbi:MAG: Polysaccharide biosynthesis protein [Gemmatimonadetes bacterium]|nr:Polysaccharide biosynthesis protein [Gemmatimonadota bacterium]
MRSQLRAFAVLGGSSLVSLFVSLVSMKAYALLIGPRGVGEIGVIQGLASLTTLLAGFGIGTGVVRLGTPMLAAGDVVGAKRLFSHARILTVGTSIATILIASLVRGPLASSMLGEPSWAWVAVTAVLSGTLGAWATLELGLLNARHAVGAIARATVVGSLGAATIGIGLIWGYGVRAVPIAIAFGQLWTAVVAGFMSIRVERAAKREAPMSVHASSPDDIGLLRFGAGYTLSMFLGVGVQYALPAVVVHRLGFDAAGQVRAALTISTAYLALFLTAMARDYYPRVCAAPSVDALNRIVNTQLGILLLLGAPLVLVLQVGSPVAVTILFSRSFAPAVEVMRWQLVGELFKFASWTFAYVILGRLPSSTYLLSETTAGATLITGVWILVSRAGIAGVGLAYAASYCCYFLLTMALVRRLGVRISATNGRYLAVSLGSAVLIALLQTVAVVPPAISVSIQIMMAAAAVAIAGRVALRSGLVSRSALHGLRAGPQA